MNAMSNIVQEQRQKLELSKKLVYEKNRKQSTAMSEKEYRWILNSIDFTISHGQGSTYLERYESGLADILQKVEEAKQLCEALKSNRIYHANERYLSILDQQLPDFFSHYDQVYHNTYCKEDLDYPLLDGLPLQHHMYHKQGIDLVEDYLNRYRLEELFLHQFQDLQEFLTYYELHMGVALEDLGVNLCEIVFMQALFVHMVNGKSLQLSSGQAKFLEEKLYHVEQVEEFVYTLYQHFSASFSKELAHYLSRGLELFVIRVRTAKETHTLHHLLVLPATKKETTFEMQESCDPVLFQRLLSNLEKAHTKEERISWILQTPLGFQDYQDLLEMDYLMEDEVIALFDVIGDVALAILFFTSFSTQFQFHRKADLHCFDEIETRLLWEEWLLSYIKEFDIQRLHAFFSVLEHL